MLGLTRALLAAGARAAVVSLWPVDDESTSLLMGELYRQLRAGPDFANVVRLAAAFGAAPHAHRPRGELHGLEPSDRGEESDHG